MKQTGDVVDANDIIGATTMDRADVALALRSTTDTRVRSLAQWHRARTFVLISVRFHRMGRLQRRRMRMAQLPHVPLTHAMSLADFDRVGLLGMGGAAVVYLVRHRATNETYAMKVQCLESENERWNRAVRSLFFFFFKRAPRERRSTSVWLTTGWYADDVALSFACRLDAARFQGAPDHADAATSVHREAALCLPGARFPLATVVFRITLIPGWLVR